MDNKRLLIRCVFNLRDQRRKITFSGTLSAGTIAVLAAKEASCVAELLIIDISTNKLFKKALRNGHVKSIAENHFDAALNAAPQSFITKLEESKLSRHLERALQRNGLHLRFLNAKNRAHNVPLIRTAIAQDPRAYEHIRMRQGRKRKRKEDIHGHLKNNPDIIRLTLRQGLRGVRAVLADPHVDKNIVADVLHHLIRTQK